MFKKFLLLVACALPCVQGFAPVVPLVSEEAPTVLLCENENFKFSYAQSALPGTSDIVHIQTNKLGSLEFAKNAGISGVLAKKRSKTVIFKHSATSTLKCSTQGE